VVEEVVVVELVVMELDVDEVLEYVDVDVLVVLVLDEGAQLELVLKVDEDVKLDVLELEEELEGELSLELDKEVDCGEADAVLLVRTDVEVAVDDTVVMPPRPTLVEVHPDNGFPLQELKIPEFVVIPEYRAVPTRRGTNARIAICLPSIFV
jgi:hypothetical protein